MSDPILGRNLYIATSCLEYTGFELAFRFFWEYGETLANPFTITPSPGCFPVTLAQKVL